MKKTILMLAAACLITIAAIFPNKFQVTGNTAETMPESKYETADICNLQDFPIKNDTSNIPEKDYDFNNDKNLDVFDNRFMESADSNEPQKKEEIRMNIDVNGKILSAILYDNPTAKAFAEQLPMTLPMLDLYGREMCYRFENEFPTDNVQYTGYDVGEIVYWPPRHSFVIMYAQNGEEFEMQKVGKIDSGVEMFNGIGNVDVSFSLAEQKSTNNN